MKLSVVRAFLVVAMTSLLWVAHDQSAVYPLISPAFEEAGAKNFLPSSSEQCKNTTEAFVISIDPDKANRFVERNRHAIIDPVLWVNGIDGFHQRNLDVWAQLTGKYPALKASNFTDKDKGLAASPHAVGCYLAHWNVLRSFAHRPMHMRPNAFLVFEDDAMCAPNLREHVLTTIRQLPDDWDLLYVGGKPITYFNGNVSTIGHDNNSSVATLRRDVCLGVFGRGQSPLAPDGSRRLSEQQQPYWRTMYMANTHAYVVNPRRLEHLLSYLQPQKHIPIDMLLGDLMATGHIMAYMTTRSWCRQEPFQGGKSLPAPETWQGYYGFQYSGRYVWQKQMHLDNCTY